MKKLLIASLIASGFVAAGAQAATANLVINATVSSKCTISTAPAAINLTIDPSTVAGPTTGTSNFGYTCTKNVTPSVFTAGQGGFFSAGNRMPAASAGTGFGAASEITKTITVSVALADAQAAAASAAYTDTVVITVNP
jgi:spore coat protein U-like protein